MSDWLSQAEVVATVRVTSEWADAEPAISETENVDGMRIVGRSVSVEVLDQLWTRKSSDAPSFPSQLEMSALGWGLAPGAKEVDLISIGASRLEPGNTYVIAFRWYPAACEGETASQGRWGAIGSGGVVPLLSSTLGRGEVAGAISTVADFVELVPSGSVRATVAGRTPRDLQALLAAGNQSLAARPAPVPAGCTLAG